MLKETIYTPQAASKGFVPYLQSIFKGFQEGQGLGKQLFVRDKKAMFRSSFIGIIWAFIPPFITAFLWIFLNSSSIIKVNTTGGIPFPLFVITGTFFWQVIMQSMNNAMNAVNNGKALLAKLNFPRESLLIHAFYNTIFDISILFLVTCIMAFVLGWRPHISLTWMPVVIGSLLITGFALGLIFHSLFYLLVDFRNFFTIGFQLLMYVSVVIFPIPSNAGWVKRVSEINPFSQLMILSRNVFTGLPVDNAGPFAIIISTASMLLVFGLVAYRITMPIIIERMGS